MFRLPKLGAALLNYCNACVIPWVGTTGCHLSCLGLSGNFTKARDTEEAGEPVLSRPCVPVFHSYLSPSLQAVSREPVISTSVATLQSNAVSPTNNFNERPLPPSPVTYRSGGNLQFLSLCGSLFLVSLSPLGFHGPFLAVFDSPPRLWPFHVGSFRVVIIAIPQSSVLLTVHTLLVKSRASSWLRGAPHFDV